MLRRAERLLEEYAEAKLALMTSVTSTTSESRQSFDDDDDDSGTANHYNTVSVNSRGQGTWNSSTVGSNDGRNSHTVCRNSGRRAASFRAAVHHSTTRNSSRENLASREYLASRKNHRTTKLAVKQSERSRDVRTPLGTISQKNNLCILGQHILPPLPADHCRRHPGGYLAN